MKKHIAILVLLLATLSVQAQYGQNFVDQNYIEVTGTAYKEVVPDEIYLNVQISEKDNKGKESVEELERKMLAKLESLGIGLKENVTLNDLSSNFRFYFLKRTDIFSTKEYTVKVGTASLAGQVISGLSDIGISNVGLNRVEYSRMDELELEVKRLSILEAKEKASLLVEALDQQLGKAIHIQEFESPRMYRAEAMEMKIRGTSNMSQADQEVEFDKIRVEARIHVKFAIN